MGRAWDSCALPALVAAQPELLRPDFKPSSDPVDVASRIIEQALTLCGTIHRYRIALVLDPDPDGPLPF